MLGKKQKGAFSYFNKGGQAVKKLLPIILLFMLSACVSETDFYRLRTDVDELKKESATTKTEVNNLRERSAGAVNEDSFKAVRESQAEVTSRLGDFSGSLNELRGRFEENRYFVEKTLKEHTAESDLLRAQISSLESNMKMLNDRISAIESAAKPKEGDSGQQGPLIQSDGAGPKAEPATPDASQKKTDIQEERTKAYDTALQAFRDKKYKEAREKFEAYIKDYPTTDLTDNAQFWIGETYYAEKNYEDAILAFEVLLKKYPDSKKASSALLKQSYAFIEIGDAKTGKIILKKLVEKYPDSKDAELARKKIAEMEKKNRKKK